MNTGVSLTKEMLDWFEALAKNGMFIVDNQGRGDFSPMIKETIRGMHEILAGGDVTLKVNASGKTDTVNALHEKLDAAIRSVNVTAYKSDDVFTP